MIHCSKLAESIPVLSGGLVKTKQYSNVGKNEFIAFECAISHPENASGNKPRVGASKKD